MVQSNQKQASLQKSLSILQAALDSSTDAILVVDLFGKIATFNPQFMRIWGIPAGSLQIGDDEKSLSYALRLLKDRPAFLSRIEEIYKNPRQRHASELEFKDGRFIESYCQPQYLDGQPAGRVWSFRDITEQKTSRRRLAQLSFGMDQMQDSAYLIAENAGFVYINNQSCKALGYSHHELLQMSVFDVDPGFPRQVWAEHWAELKGKRSITLETVHQTKDGRLFPVEVVANYFEYANVGYNLAIARDISERKRIEEALQQAALIYQNSSEAMLLADADDRILTINAAFTAITGYQLDEVIGKHIGILNTGGHSDAMWQAIHSKGSWQGEIWDKRKNGELFAKWLTINTIFDAEQTMQRRVALFSDITEKKKAEGVIWQQANFDPLTQLPNRRMFYDRLSQDIKKAHREHKRLALLFIDLDLFKEVNDTLGHDMGDKLLQIAAQRILASVRETDTVARLGGDEFTVILSDVGDPCNAERIAGNLLQKMTDCFELGNEIAYISTSVGIAFYPDDADNLKSLLKHADQAMYAAKRQGRNQYCFFIPTMQESAQARLRLSNDLRLALAGQQFYLCYQPIVELATNTVRKAEALIRWQHPTRGLISPADFIPIAEETGLISSIGNWIFQEAAEQTSRWRQSIHEKFQISINKSPVQFRNERDSHRDWLDRLEALSLSGQSVVIEITEGLLLDANNSVAEQLLSFRDAGIQVSLDDFGTGYSSLSYLKKFDIDYLKIDQSFVRNLAIGSDDMALCEAIIVMAHKLGIKVIAEGIETSSQRELLTAAGCDFGQGYLFAKPLPAQEFERLFADCKI
ncbi:MULTISPECIES: EAL and GGDEF domain-containing protein [Methylomonas]|uniref:Diguanylate cyclase n=2 Tax=Methylomonas TaxID=416 RepID=A0A126T5S1_9GAMM|nr:MULTISPECIES: EAL domain-containing protein [Methylomonas]AMK77433.1 diguanylate cyclase [Methylomonas denitrificans]OAI05024.1 diguanylate cyclase [Methylomonas methanica]TCV84526.1 PAS domain S-box-containing protein/diguanylate cyclase (GGDEF)-like protein [Methylomonas methanica]